MKQKTTKFLRSFLSLALAIVLCLGTALPALAALNGDGAAEGTETNPAKVGITKLLTMPEGTTTPAARFDFVATKVSKNGEIGPVAFAAMPNLGTGDGTGPDSVTYTSSFTGTTAGGVKSVYIDAPDLLGNIVWPSAGIYVYEISEKKDTYTGTAQETMNYSDAAYTISVYVKEKTLGSGFYVSAVTATIKAVDNTDQTANAKVDPTPGTGGSHSGMLFTNNYVKTGKGGDPAVETNQVMSVSKKVAGDYAEKDRYFSYELTVTQPSSVTGGTVGYKAYVLNGSNQIVTSSSHTTAAIEDDSYGKYFIVTSGSTAMVNLKHDEKLVFTDVHIGAAYVAVEKIATGYTPSAVITVNGQIPENKAGTLGSELSTDSRIIGDQGKNAADFTNTFQSVTPTGIIIDNLPFILLLAAAAGALILFVVVKARKRRGYIVR